jgi:hypothetical protein
MLTPGRAVVIDCETTDLPGALSGKVGCSNRGIGQIAPAMKARCVANERVSGHRAAYSPVGGHRLMQESCI